MGSNVALPLTGELGKTLTFFIPEFPYLSKGGIKNCCMDITGSNEIRSDTLSKVKS